MNRSLLLPFFLISMLLLMVILSSQAIAVEAVSSPGAPLNYSWLRLSYRIEPSPVQRAGDPPEVLFVKSNYGIIAGVDEDVNERKLLLVVGGSCYLLTDVIVFDVNVSLGLKGYVSVDARLSPLTVFCVIRGPEDEKLFDNIMNTFNITNYEMHEFSNLSRHPYFIVAELDNAVIHHNFTVDPARWAVYDRERFLGDLVLLYDRGSPTGVFGVYSRVPEAQEIMSHCKVNYTAMVYHVDSNRSVNITVNVEGLGVIGPERLARGFPIPPIYDKIIVGGGASNVIDMSAMSRYYRVWSSGETYHLQSKYLDIVEEATGRAWSLDRRYCIYERSEVGNTTIYTYIPAIQVNNISAILYPVLDNITLAYDLATGLLVWQGSSEAGSSIISEVYIPTFLLGKLGGSMVHVFGTSALAEMKLVRVEGMGGVSRAELSSSYDYRPAQAVIPMASSGIVSGIIIGWSRGLRRAIGLGLLFTGLSLVAIYYFVGYGGVGSDVLDQLYIGRGGVSNITFAIPLSAGDNASIYVNPEGCREYLFNITLRSPGGVEDTALVEAKSVTAVLYSKSSLRAVHVVSITVTPSDGECIDKMVEVRARGLVDSGRPPGLYKILVLGFLLAVLGSALLFLPRGHGLGRHGLYSLYISTWGVDVLSLSMLVLYVAIYFMNIPFPSCVTVSCIRVRESAIASELIRPVDIMVLIVLLYSVIIASLVTGLYLEMGLEKRLVLNGQSSVRRVGLKVAAIALASLIPVIEYYIVTTSIIKWYSFSKITAVFAIAVIFAASVLLVSGIVASFAWLVRAMGPVLVLGVVVSVSWEYLLPPEWRVSGSLSGLTGALEYGAGLDIAWAAIASIIGIFSWLLAYYGYSRGDYID